MRRIDNESTVNIWTPPIAVNELTLADISANYQYSQSVLWGRLYRLPLWGRCRERRGDGVDHILTVKQYVNMI